MTCLSAHGLPGGDLTSRCFLYSEWFLRLLLAHRNLTPPRSSFRAMRCPSHCALAGMAESTWEHCVVKMNQHIWQCTPPPPMWSCRPEAAAAAFAPPTPRAAAAAAPHSRTLTRLLLSLFHSFPSPQAAPEPSHPQPWPTGRRWSRTQTCPRTCSRTRWTAPPRLWRSTT